MPLTPAEQIQRIQQVRELWRTLDQTISYGVEGAHNPIQMLPRMERSTRMVLEQDPAMLQQGWHRTPALDGYAAWLKAFQILDSELSAKANSAIEHASTILGELRNSFQLLSGDHPSNRQVTAYRDQKLAQLQANGEVYMLTGHAEHFNITRIRRLSDGSYSYTLYDAGHETRIVNQVPDNNGEVRAIVNAVEERRIRPGTNMGDLILADVNKLISQDDTPQYAKSKQFIEAATAGNPIRVEQDFAQRRYNCTTRGQRILIEDILGDDATSKRLAKFIADNDGNTRAVHQGLADREHQLRTRPRPIHHEQAVPWQRWSTYESSAFGYCLRFEQPFSAMENKITPAMVGFKNEMHRHGIAVEWGWRDGNAYAYVPKNDIASISNLTRKVQSEARMPVEHPPARTTESFIDRAGNRLRAAPAGQLGTGAIFGSIGAGAAAAIAYSEAPQGQGAIAAYNAASEAILPGSTSVGTNICKGIGTVTGGVTGAVVAAGAGSITFVATGGPANIFLSSYASAGVGALTYTVTQPVAAALGESTCTIVGDLIPDAVKQAASHAVNMLKSAMGDDNSKIATSGSTSSATQKITKPTYLR